MAAMMGGGDFVEAYVLKNACKEKVRRMEEAEARSSTGAGSALGEKKKKAAASSGRGGGLFGLMKKKVHHHGAAAGSAAMETSEASA